MLSCRRATELLSEAQEHALPLRQRTALKLHTLMCKGCRNFGMQMQWLRRFARAYAPSSGERTDPTARDSPPDTPAPK